jgi:hypothetical protein
MRMADVQIGHIYRLVDFRGKSGTKLLGRKVRVLETGITPEYSQRADRIKVMMLKENENGELVDDTRYDDVTPWEKLIMAREIITLEEAERREEAERLEREERERKAEERRSYIGELEKLVAMRLGISADHVSANAMFDEALGEHVPYRAAVDQNGLKAMLESDPDPEIIAGVLDEIPYSTMTAAQIAEAIVGALRGKPEEDEPDVA